MQPLGAKTPVPPPPYVRDQFLKWFCEAGGAHLMKPGWSKAHTHSNPTNLALFRHKITLYRFNHGGSYYCRGLKWEQGALSPLHFNHLAI